MQCKKLIAIFVILSFFTLFLFSKNVKAENEPTITMAEGASIRTLSPSGLRFSATLDGDFSGTDVKYGFIFLKGDKTREQLIANFEAGNAASVEVTPDENVIAASVVNIPASGYETDLSALAYADIDGTKLYASAKTTRNIKEIAQAMVDEGSDNELANSIVNVSTLNLNGGLLLGDKAFKIGAYNSGSTGTYGITLCTKASRASGGNYWWYQVTLAKTPHDSKLFNIVEVAPSGTELVNEDYEYILQAYTPDTNTLQALSGYEFIHISDLAAGGIVRGADNFDVLLGNKVSLMDGDSLPHVTKEYYEFVNWYTLPDFSSDPVTTKSGNLAQNFYAKFSPINYTLTYHLQDGLCNGAASLDPVQFNVESETINLPLESTMTREDYSFIEWNTSSDGTGDTITSIPSGSHGNKDVYAIWASNLPTTVELTTKEIEIFENVTPTKFVREDFIAGKFTINGNTYTVGDGELYSNIAAAMAEAKADDIIYLFAGTYTGNFPVNKARLQIIGPNYGNHSNTASPLREPEAIISNTKITGSAGTTFDGVKFSGTTALSAYGTGYTIRNCYIDSKGQNCYSNSEVLFFSPVTNLTIEYNYINPNSSVRPIRIEGNGTNVTISNNYCVTTTNVTDFIRIVTIIGTFNFTNNYTSVKCSGWLISNSSKCADATVNIKDNVMVGGTDFSGISFAGATSASNLQIIGNTIDVSGTRIKIAASTNEPTIDISYNKFKNSDSSTIKLNFTAATTNFSMHHNYATTTYSNSSGSIAPAANNDFASEAALDEAYALLN